MPKSLKSTTFSLHCCHLFVLPLRAFRSSINVQRTQCSTLLVSSSSQSWINSNEYIGIRFITGISGFLHFKRLHWRDILLSWSSEHQVQESARARVHSMVQQVLIKSDHSPIHFLCAYYCLWPIFCHRIPVVARGTLGLELPFSSVRIADCHIEITMG